MATIVCRLFAPFLKGDELVTQIYEGHGLALAAQAGLTRSEAAQHAGTRRARLVKVRARNAQAFAMRFSVDVPDL